MDKNDQQIVKMAINTTALNATTIAEFDNEEHHTFFWRMIRMVSYTLVLTLHISNIVVIATKKKLHATYGWLLISLSTSDALQLLIKINLVRTAQHEIDIFLKCFFTSCFTASLFANLAISIDKYIAIQYSLRYHYIVTQANTLRAIVVLWLTSAVLSVLPTAMAEATDQMLYYHGVQYFVRFLCIVFLLVCAFYIRNVRNAHKRTIKERSRYLGANGEPANHVKRIKSSMADVIRLNIITAFTVLLLTSTSAMFYYGTWSGSPVVRELMIDTNGFYLISNPIIYILVIKNLRKEYRRILRCRKARVSAST